LLLIGALLAAPSVSGARAAVKQYLSKISPTAVSGNTTGNSFTVTITDCGGTPLEPPCTASSTIQLGTAQILVPTRFSNVTFVSATSPNGRHWTGSWDGTYIQASAVTGTDKLNAGEKVAITFTADVSGCETGSFEFTTTSWGSTPTHTGETFLPLQQPTVAVNGCAVGPDQPITDPLTGQTETITGFTGLVNITFGGDTANCSFDTRPTAVDGDGGTTYGQQWAQYHLATQVLITPGEGFTAGGPKISTSEFDQSIAGGDSSWYLVCYAVPIDDDHATAFETIGNGLAENRQIPPGSGIHYWIGILASCDVADAPCVLDQFLTTGGNPTGTPSTPPWSPGANRVVISIEMPPNDPLKH
jgi:hypothetical protein